MSLSKHVMQLRQQEVRANAHETRDSISLILYAGCLGRSPVIGENSFFKCALQPEIAKNSLTTPVVRVQGRLR